MLNLRKLFNIPSRAERAILTRECADLLILAQTEVREHYNREAELERIHNTRCMVCFETKTVDHIVAPDIHVNHCTNCSHEWNKYIVKTMYRRDIIESWLYKLEYTGDIKEISTSIEQKLSPYTAEAIYDTFLNEVSFQAWTIWRVSLKSLRRRFRSVYDCVK